MDPEVNILTFSDADFAKSVALNYDTTNGLEPRDLTGCTLLMMVRKSAEDHEVFISLSSADSTEIDIAEPYNGLFTLLITRERLSHVPPGEYVHSLILVNPDGWREDVWRGTLTHAIGPTR